MQIINTKKLDLLEILGNSTENKILDFLVEGVGIDYTKKDVVDGCGISRPTFYKIFPQLLKAKIVKPTRLIGRVQLYTLIAVQLNNLDIL
ncbi:MAG TPA: hypothetical protein VJH04_01480 [archaeon]|nr:hypothetical protein [archaeon]